MARTPYRWFNINRIGPGKRVDGKSGKAETTIFWPHYSGKCRTVGTYNPRRNHRRVTASRQTEKTVDPIHDVEEWTGCEYIQLKEMSQDRAQWRRKISEWSFAVANLHRGRSTNEWVTMSEWYIRTSPWTVVAVLAHQKFWHGAHTFFKLSVPHYCPRDIAFVDIAFVGEEFFSLGCLLQ